MERQTSDRVVIEDPDVVKTNMKVQKAGTVYVGTALAGKRINLVGELVDADQEEEADEADTTDAEAEAEG